MVRALRIDPGLHYFGMKRDEAIELFSNYTWDNTETAENEVRFEPFKSNCHADVLGLKNCLT